MTTKARLDADRTAEPRTRLVAKVPPTDCYSGGATHYEGEDGQRVALTEPTTRSARNPLLSAVVSALRTLGREPSFAPFVAEGRVWLGGQFAEEYSAAEVWVRSRCLKRYSVHASRREGASALVREWVREQLDAWVQDDGKGE